MHGHDLVQRPRHPKTLRHQHGFSSHTFLHRTPTTARQGENSRTFKSLQGIANPGQRTGEGRARLIGQDRESHQRDLYDAIALAIARAGG
ncbi:MAG: hypothetical protein U1F68_03190 [Gammaproteobacteria bacterium]